MVKGVVTDDDNRDFGFVIDISHVLDYGPCLNFQPKLKIRFGWGSRIGLEWRRR